MSMVSGRSPYPSKHKASQRVDKATRGSLGRVDNQASYNNPKSGSVNWTKNNLSKNQYGIDKKNRISRASQHGLSNFALLSKKNMSNSWIASDSSGQDLRQEGSKTTHRNFSHNSARNQGQIYRNEFEQSRFGQIHNFLQGDFKTIPRGGVIFYTFVNGEFFMCLGKDRETGDLTDFGGGRRKKETPIQCALREGAEESRFVFGEISPEGVNSYWCLYSRKMLIIFVPVTLPEDFDQDDWNKIRENNEDYSRNFSRESSSARESRSADVREITSTNFVHKSFLDERQENDSCYNELSDIIWLNQSEILNLLSSRPDRKMFSPVRKFIVSSSLFRNDTINIFRENLRMLFQPVISPDILELSLPIKSMPLKSIPVKSEDSMVSQLESEPSDEIIESDSTISNLEGIPEDADLKEGLSEFPNARREYPAWTPFDTPAIVQLN